MSSINHIQKNLSSTTYYENNENKLNLKLIDSICSKESYDNENFYYKSCLWSPDKLCLLVFDNKNEINLYNLPPIYYNETESNWKSSLCIQEGELIYDSCWYPRMDSQIPTTCVFVSSSKDHPVHMWDAYTGKLRCSYSTYNKVYEIMAPVSLGFNCDGTHLFCGSKGKIDIFDVSIPSEAAMTIESNKNRMSQHGIFSCFSFDDTDNENIFVAGSYNKTVGIYDQRSGEISALIDLESIAKTHNKSVGGVTKVYLSSHKLFIGCRKSSSIYEFDLRNSSDKCRLYDRTVSNQQRIDFCYKRFQNRLISGDTDGNILSWDLNSNHSSNPTNIQKLTDLSIPGCDFNDTYNLLAITTGSRNFCLNLNTTKIPLPSINLYTLN